MSKILITGNGFDLFHGLPTRYDHFMAVMVTLEKCNFTSKIVFDDLFGDYFRKYFEREYELIVKKYKVENIVFDESRLIEIKEILERNNWYNYFKTASEIETWIDFENEINTALQEVLNILEDSKTSINRKSYICQSHPLLKKFDWYSRGKRYLKTIKDQFGIEMFDVINDKLLFEDLSTSLNEFIVLFNRYFVDIVNEFYSNTNVNFLAQLNNADEIYTFNYTPTVEKLYSIDSSKVTYLHGKVASDDFAQNLILGVDDISDNLKNHKLYDFTKYYQKINKNANLKFIEFETGNMNYSNEDVFYVIGHSLDESDKVYIRKLFSYLDWNPKSKLCVFYYNNKDKENKLRNLLSIIEERTLSDRNTEGRFYFMELTVENLAKEFKEPSYNIASELHISVGSITAHIQ